MFDWLGGLITAIGDAIGGTVSGMGESIANLIFDSFLQWIYEAIFNGIADFFTMMGNMGTEIFELDWVQGTVEIFRLFGWALFVVGLVVAIFDVAVEYQSSGRVNPKTTAINILKGFIACNLVTVLPIELYKLCISLQNTFAHDLSAQAAGSQHMDIGAMAINILNAAFTGVPNVQASFASLMCLIAFGYCVVKVFFQNIKRGGIILIQMSVGTLYLFSIPRGYTDGFNQWMRQVIAICLTAFMQTTLLFIGLLTFKDHMILGLGIMLSATEVPRIAQQFGLDSSVKMNVSSVVHTTATAVNLGRAIAR